MQFKEKLEGIVQTTLNGLKQAIDADNIVGNPISGGDGLTIIPISKVSYGYVGGGGEYGKTGEGGIYPYAGGSGAGVSIQPIGFLICGGDKPEFIKVDNEEDEDKWLKLAKSALNLLKKQ